MQPDPEIGQGRRPKNQYEAQFFDLAATAGWVLTTRGWPDFFLKLGDQVCVVEVKPAKSRAFRQEQARVLGALSGAGIPCFCWSPDGGLEKVTVGVGGLLLEVVDVEVRELLDVCEGESEGKHLAVPAAIADPQPSPAQTVSGTATAAQVQSEVDRVEGTYAAVMKPRRTEMAEDERAIIRNALKVAKVHELEVCIRTCERSDFHMKRGNSIARKGQKYNSIGKILKPRPRLGETQRSRIDWWLDRAEIAGVPRFPSADPAIVNQRQVEVRRGHHSRDEEMLAKAEQAKAWLAEHGIETVEGESGPLFRRAGK